MLCCSQFYTFAHSNEMFTLWESMEFPTGNKGLACQRYGQAVHALRPKAVAAMGTLRDQMTEMMWIEY